MKVDLVVTTIFEPKWLAGYLNNIRRHGRESQVTIRVICDKKTPATVWAAAKQAAKDGFQIECPTLDEQEAYIAKLGLPSDFVPWNTDYRRNLGFLRAWETGADVLISIDDDNYCRDDSDYVGAHLAVTRNAGDEPGAQFASGAPWFNICTRMTGSHKDPVYARGFPYYARKPETLATLGPVPAAQAKAGIAINAGLWLDDPDVDAVTRLAQRPRMTATVSPAVVLGPDTWTPINTQNTTLRRDAIAAYYYTKMGYPLQGMKIDRFGDIFSGYFVQKCAKHLGQLVRVGDPAANHNRTPHNLFKDLYQELAGMIVFEELLPWLLEVKLSGRTYSEVFASLAEALRAQAPNYKGLVWDDGGRDFLVDTANSMDTWLACLKRMG